MKTALIIPAYKPAQEVISLLKQFEGNDAFLPIVVDDGSGEPFRPVFDALPQGVTLLRHPENRGKGDRKSTRLNSSHPTTSRMPSSA